MLYGSLFSLCMCMFLWECLRLSFSLQFSGFVFAACFRQFVSPTFRAHVGMHVGGPWSAVLFAPSMAHVPPLLLVQKPHHLSLLSPLLLGTVETRDAAPSDVL